MTMLKLERTFLKCDKAGCPAAPTFKVVVYSDKLGDGVPSVYCPEHSMEAVAYFQANCKDANMDYEVSA